MAKTVGRALALLALVAVGAILAAGAITFIPGLMRNGEPDTTRDTRVINAIHREEQVVLLSLGVQGISQKTADSTFMGVKIPGSTRATFIQYTFNAKLGIEGKDVTITKTGENAYRVVIPAFKFIGHDDVQFKLLLENNGILSAVTPEIDTVGMVNTILSNEAQTGYVSSNQEILRDQAKAFYSGIIATVDPLAQLTFEFSKV